MLLPWITLAIVNSAIYARLTRSAMLDALSQDFIRTARAKGLSPVSVNLKHGLRAGITRSSQSRGSTSARSWAELPSSRTSSGLTASVKPP